MRGGDGERSDSNTPVLTGRCRGSILRDEWHRFCLQFTLCAPLLCEGKLCLLHRNYLLASQQMYTKEGTCCDSAQPPALAFVHLVQCMFLRSGAMRSLQPSTICVWQCVHDQQVVFEYRMFVVKGRNSFWREIGAFTFDIISKWFTGRLCQRIPLLLSFVILV